MVCPSSKLTKFLLPRFLSNIPKNLADAHGYVLGHSDKAFSRSPWKMYSRGSRKKKYFGTLIPHSINKQIADIKQNQKRQ